MDTRIGRWLLGPLLLGLWLAASASPAQEQRPAEPRTIRIATEGAFPPFNYMEGNEPQGFEIDLGKALQFSRVEVQNRSDCCEERAIPLAIEISKDGKKWKEVARKTELFTVWNADFDPVKARYVRTRALSRTFLHLVRVSVRER